MKISALMRVNLVKKVSKIVFSLLFISLLGLAFTSSVNAQYTPDNDVMPSHRVNAGLQNVDSNVELNMTNGMQILVIEFLSAISCQLTGMNPASESGKCLGFNSNTGKIGFVESGGLIGLSTKLVTMTLNPPASSTQYFAYLKNNFNGANSAYAIDASPISDGDGGSVAYSNCYNHARGVGFCSLGPVLDLWITMRNIVYLIFVLVFIVIGVGIMLRLHVDPRTVMTIQNQIPKIIVGIILITFSFAIAGLMIDIMWVATYLFALVIASATQVQGTTPIEQLRVAEEILTAGNPFAAAEQIHYSPADRLLGPEIPLNGPLNMADTIGSAFSSLIQTIITGGQGSNILTQVFGGVLHILAFIVLAIAILVSLIRLWFSLVMAFINILLDVIFAPFWLLAGVLPGSSGMTAWFRDLAANLAVFPTAIAFLLFASYFVNWYATAAEAGAGTDLTTITLPLLGGTDANATAAIIGLGFILMLPTLLGQVKQFFKAPKMNFGNMMSPIKAGMGGPGRLVGGARGYVGGQKYELTDKGTEQISRKQRAARAFGMVK